MEIQQQIENLSDEEFDKLIQSRKKKKEEDKKKQKQDYEALKAETIVGLSIKAENLHKKLKIFKKEAFESLQTFYACLQEYSERHADAKGNFKIENEQYRISYKKQGKPSFDERSNQAEKHIIDFLNNRYEGDKDTKELILSLLERKNGHLDINLVQKLYKMEGRFEDKNWKQGISLLKESYQFIHSKDYITFEKKNDDGEWKPLTLQFSKINYIENRPLTK